MHNMSIKLWALLINWLRLWTTIINKAYLWTTIIYNWITSLAWDLLYASFNSKELDILEDTAPAWTAFNSDWTKMYILWIANLKIFEYNLSTAYDITTAIISTSFTIPNVSWLHFKPDWTKLYLTWTTNDLIYQYDLSIAWDVNTLLQSWTFNVSSIDLNMRDVAVSSDWTKMFTSGSSWDSVYQYTMSTPWDISTLSYDSLSYNTSAHGTDYWLTFSPDWSKFFLWGYTKVSQFNLSNITNITTASHSKDLNTSTQDNWSILWLSFNWDWTQLNVISTGTDNMYQYNL